MGSLRRKRGQLAAWRRYARRTYWNPRVSRPWWESRNTVIPDGHYRAWVRVVTEEERRALVAARRWQP